MLNFKLPHWAISLVSLAGVVLAWVLAQNASGNLVLPAALVGVLSLLNGALGLFSSSALAPKPLLAADPAAPGMGGVEASVASATAAEAAALQASEPKS